METLGIGAFLANLMIIFPGYANKSEILPFSTNMTKNEAFSHSVLWFFAMKAIEPFFTQIFWILFLKPVMIFLFES